MRLLEFVFLVSLSAPAIAGQKLPCAGMDDNILVNVPGYDNEIGAKQPAYFVDIKRCVTRQPICVLLKSGRVVGGNRQSEVFFQKKSIVFAVIQTLKTKARTYCGIATLVPEIGGDNFWAYRVFTPNGGWMPQEIEDVSTQPKNSEDLYAKLEENFAAFQYRMRAVLADGNFLDGEYGYHKGDVP